MTELEKAARQALEALKQYSQSDDDRLSIAMHILNQALEQQQQPCKYGNQPSSCTNSPMDCQCALDATLEQQPAGEPVALQMDVIVVNLVREGINKHRARELAEHFIKHTRPQPAAQWVGLTAQQQREGMAQPHRGSVGVQEAKLREKNGGGV